MAAWDSADLLLSFNQKAGRPLTADPITDAQKYQRLSRAQNRVIGMMMGVVPYSLYPKVGYGSLPQLITTDQQVFTFGADANGYPTFPGGKGGIYPSLTAIPDCPWVEGRDYLSEGTQIRIPNNNTYSGTLYWYGVQNPPDFDAIEQPSIFPEAARELIVIEGVRQFAQEGGRNLAVKDEMSIEWATAWPVWCLMWKTQFRSGGALRSFTGLQVALGAQGWSAPL